MGGNATINGHRADKLMFSSPGAVIDFKNDFLEPLFNTQFRELELYITGSFRNALKGYMPPEGIYTLNDIDIQINRLQAFDLETRLKAWQDSVNGLAPLVPGYKKSGNQYICLFRVGTKILQIDFQLVEFEDGFPTTFSLLAHSSNPDDFVLGIKGVFHKLMLRALTGIHGEEVFLYNPMKSEIVKTKIYNHYAFSVEHGLREKYKPVGSVDGEDILTEIPKSEFVYETDLKKIFGAMFCAGRSDGYVEEMYTKHMYNFESFVGLVKLMNDLLNENERKAAFINFSRLLHGKGAQSLDSNEFKDLNNKAIAIQYLLDNLEL